MIASAGHSILLHTGDNPLAPQLAQHVRDHLFSRPRDSGMNVGEEPDINALAAELLGSGFSVQVSCTVASELFP